MSSESDAFPPANIPAQTSADVAVATFTALQETQRAAAAKAVADSEIIDPSVKKASDAPETRPESKAENLVEGASTSPPGIPDSLLERAIALDYTEDEARAMGVSALRKTVVRLEKQAERAERHVERRVEPEEAEEFTLPPIDDGTDTEYDPKYLEGMSKRDKLALENAREIAELKKQLAQRGQDEAARAQRAAESSFEKLIVADEDLHDELGDDPGVPTNKRHLTARQEMWEIMRPLVNRGKSFEEAYAIARAGLFHEKLTGKVKTAAAKEMAGKLTKSAKQHSRPPTIGKPVELPPGRDRAIAALTEFQKQNS